MWPDARVVRFVNDNFIPARVHVREDPEAFKAYGERYNAQWTPSILELDPDGEERHRVEGFLGVDDLLSELSLGLAQMAFKRGDWADAEHRFREVADDYPSSDAAAESLYWAGVSRYKASKDPSALAQTYEALNKRYPESTWLKKASVWTK